MTGDSYTLRPHNDGTSAAKLFFSKGKERGEEMASQQKNRKTEQNFHLQKTYTLFNIL